MDSGSEPDPGSDAASHVIRTGTKQHQTVIGVEDVFHEDNVGCFAGCLAQSAPIPFRCSVEAVFVVYEGASLCSVARAPKLSLSHSSQEGPRDPRQGIRVESRTFCAASCAPSQAASSSAGCERSYAIAGGSATMLRRTSCPSSSGSPGRRVSSREHPNESRSSEHGSCRSR